jgi:hypothetical protein
MHSLSTSCVRRLCLLGVTAAIGVSAAPAHATVVPSAATQAAGPIPTNTTSNSQAGLLQSLAGTNDDISGLAYQVLMNATNDNDNDLEQIMAEVQAQTKAKQALRNVLAQVAIDVAANQAEQSCDVLDSGGVSDTGPGCRTRDPA